MNRNCVYLIAALMAFAIACSRQNAAAPSATGLDYDHVGLHDRKATKSDSSDLSVKKDYSNGFIDFKLIKKTKIEIGELPVFPSELRELDGKTITLSGFMTPYDSLKDMTFFLLMSVQTGCFFCDPPSLLDVVLVRQKVDEGEAPPYIDGAVTVKGTFDLWEEESAETAHEMFFFYIKDAEVKPFES